MKPKLILLNLLLLAGLGAIGWQVGVKMKQAEALRRSNLNVAIKPAPPPPLLPAPKPESPVPAKYLEVAEKNLFSKDRNPTVIVDPPKVEAPKPQPPMPVVYGVMGFASGFRAIMAEKPGDGTKAIRAGDTIGEYKVLKLDARDILFEWNGKQIAKKIEDLVDRSSSLASAQQGGGGQGGAAPSGPAAPAAPPPPRPQVVTNNNPTVNDLGVQMTDTIRGCKPGWQSDGIAVGAVVDGYRKMVNQSPFGANCRWIRQ